jgi:predicted metal-dependent hydrolase
VPPHAYVPGQTARHPDGSFDAIKASVSHDVLPASLHLTEAWAAGRAYLDAGFYWECHEVLEAVWMRTPEGSAERDMVQALIQLANARLKQRMGRNRAAWRLCGMVNAHLACCPKDRAILGLEAREVRGWVQATQRQVEDRQ